MGQAGSDCTREWVAALQNFYRTHSVNMTRASQKPPDMLGPRQAFPMIRRVALAQLVRAWLTRMQRQLPENLETDLQDLFYELYEAHRVAAMRKGIMEYFHISKAGGTSWCHAAKLNGCRAQVYDSAYICQINELDDRVRWLNNTFHRERTGRNCRWGTWGRAQRWTEMRTCEQRYEFAALMGWQYFSNEYTLHEGFEDPDNVGLCTQFFNVILIRDPIKRMLSHLKFIIMQMKWDYRDNDLFHRTFTGTDAAFWEQWGPVLVDNYMLRGMLGETVYHGAAGSIGPRHVTHGSFLLLQYDLVVDLEADGGHDTLDDVIFRGVGWPNTLRNIHDKNSVVLAQRLNLTYEDYLPRDMDTLNAKQGPDVEFYSFGRVLVKLDSLLFNVARQLRMRPLAAVDLEAAAGNPRQVACGLLRRGPRLPNSTADRWEVNPFYEETMAKYAKARAEQQAKRAAAMAKAAAEKEEAEKRARQEGRAG